MKVRELIEMLQQKNPDDEVYFFADEWSEWRSVDRLNNFPDGISLETEYPKYLYESRKLIVEKYYNEEWPRLINNND